VPAPGLLEQALDVFELEAPRAARRQSRRPEVASISESANGLRADL
jgi:hypothetical protein